MLLKGIEDLLIDSGSGKLHFGFFFIAEDGEDSFCGNVGQQRRRMLDAPVVDLCVIFSIFQGYPVQGAGCKLSILMKPNPFLKKKKQ